ncbi:MAG: rhomboid family intramembrane serine protease [Planctomycetota bacterium]
MEPNRILVFIVAAWCTVAIVRLARLSLRRYLGWVAVNVFVLVAMGVAHLAWPGREGGVGAALWGTLYLAPLLGARRLGKLMLAGRYDAAERLARVLKWIHPADGWREQPRLVRAMALAARGRTDEAAREFAEIGSGGKPIGRAAAIQVLKLQGRWAELRDMLAADLERGDVRRDRVSAGYYVRALGETGDVEAMLEAFARLRPFIESSGAANRTMARLVVLAFAGRVEAAERLLGGPLSGLNPHAREFWLGTAALAASRRDEGLARLELALASADGLTKAAIGRRLAEPPPVAEGALTPAALETLEQVERDCSEEERYGTGAVAGAARPYAVYALLAANLAYYAAEVALGGGEDKFALYRLGALVAEDVVKGGEWWRVAASAFLHAGGVHLALNMFALLVLGPFVERSLGAVRFAAVYVAAGLGAAGFHLMLASGRAPQLVVGASGCIMGLVGATGAVLLRGWWSEGARVARRRLAWVCVIVAVQVAFDILTPEVSMSMHSAGLVAGFAAGLALYRPARGPSDALRDSAAPPTGSRERAASDPTGAAE